MHPQARKGTVRQWIKEQKEADPNWKPPKPNMTTGNPWAKQPPQAQAAAEEIPTGQLWMMHGWMHGWMDRWMDGLMVD